MLRFLTLMLCLVAHVAGFNLAARREVIQTAIGVATLATPLAPAARKQASVMPNKVEGTGANAGSYIRDQYKAEYEAMAGDKGSRGVASKEFEMNDTVQKNCDLNGGVARDANGRKIARADRQPAAGGAWPQAVGRRRRHLRPVILSPAEDHTLGSTPLLLLALPSR